MGVMRPREVFERGSLAIRRDHSLGSIMDRLAKAHGTRVLVEESTRDLSLTYRQAAKRVRRWAGGVATETKPGDRVVVATGNGYEQFLLCLAVARAGCIAVPVNDRMRPEEIEHVRLDAEAALVIRTVADVDGGRPLNTPVPVNPGDVAALFYTSGTTGKPKGVALSHQSLLGSTTTGALWPSGLRHDEAVVSLPIAHIMGFVAVMALASAGIPVFMIPRFRPLEVLDAIERRRSTLFIGVPAMYRLLEEAGAADRDLSSIRVWASGADSMPSDLAARFKSYGASLAVPFIGPLGEAAFMEGYGMVELGGGAAAKISPPMLSIGLGDSLGITMPGYRFRVVDRDDDDVAIGTVGELWVKGPGVTTGYWGDEQATLDTVTADGWVRTGDLARKGPLGLAFFAGRKKDVIMHGGYTVYALEIERALEMHPAVAEAAALGRPDSRLGEVPVAAVRLVEGASVDVDDLLAFAAEHLGDYKVVKDIVVVDDMPRTGTRKVMKRELLPLFE